MTVDLHRIVHERGGDLYSGGRAATIPGPGHSKGDRSLSLRLSEDGTRVIYHSFAGDLQHRDVMAYLGIEPGEVREATPADRAKERARREHERRILEAQNRTFCKSVWEGTEEIEGTPAEAYLYSRNLIAEGLPDLRYHPAAPRTKDQDREDAPKPHAAMVALVREASGAPTGLHVTFVTADGRKAFGDRSRLMFGNVAGAAVHLGSPVGGVLAVGEGIETCGAYANLKGVTTWPTLSTSGLRNFVVPSRVRKLVIASDGDKGGAEAAQALAQRACRFCDVEIDPAPDGQDWADVLGETA
jgi:putative DNA primase/helicase